MSSSKIAERQISIADQTWFAALSGDWNPLHVDPVAARRTMFGRPIVHGMHLLLWALDQFYASPAAPDAPFTSCSVRFHKPAYLDEALELVAAPSDLGVDLEVRSGGALLCRARLSAPRQIADGPAWAPADHSRRMAPKALDIAQCDGASGVTAVDAPRDGIEGAFPAAAARLGAVRIAALLSVTRIVGMECPGLHAIFSSLNFSCIEDTQEAVAWRVVKATARLSMVTLDFAGGGLAGTIDGFVRRPAGDGLDFAQIAALAPAKAFEGRRALVVGGSRGIGRTTAFLLAAGGADVALTYRVGHDEAASAVAAIVAGGGRARSHRLDLAEPEAAIAEITAQGFQATELYVFATPPIFVRKTAVFEQGLMDRFFRAYVTDLMRTVRAVQASRPGPLAVFAPSTEALDLPRRELLEYQVAKAAMEKLCELMTLFDEDLRFVVRRLPRIATDQTQTLLDAPAEDPVPILLEICRSMGGRPLDDRSNPSNGQASR